MCDWNDYSFMTCDTWTVSHQINNDITAQLCVVRSRPFSLIHAPIDLINVWLIHKSWCKHTLGGISRSQLPEREERNWLEVVRLKCSGAVRPAAARWRARDQPRQHIRPGTVAERIKRCNWHAVIMIHVFRKCADWILRVIGRSYD